MKAVLLAGGTGSRLYPLTKITNKHLLPVYNRPMIHFPLFLLKEVGIKDILIISGPGHCGDFLELLGSGSEFGLNLSYDIQKNAGGIAQALGMAERYVGDEKFIVMLADNIFLESLKDYVADFEQSGEAARIILAKVPNPKSYGVAELKDGEIVEIVEKPENPKSDLAVTGLYMYDSQVFDIVRQLVPSGRGELEVTDVNSAYLQRGLLKHRVYEGFWGDCGESFDSLADVAGKLRQSRLARIDF